MRSILIIISSLLFSVFMHGQKRAADEEISSQDKILLENFWKNFTDAVIRSDKAKLATLCEFPFYCSPCISYVESKNENLYTVKVSRALYDKKHYKIFVERALKTEVKKHQKFNIRFFTSYFNKEMKRKEVYFYYTMVPPSKEWEGLQGRIYLGKTKGQFKIAGIDTIP